jgi:hypothetical protein
MAVQIAPVQKRDKLGKLLTIGGAVAGGFFGGPSGALAGASAGQTASGLLAGGPPPQPVQSPEAQGMARRSSALGEDPTQQIAQAQSALSGLPPDQFAETRRALDQAAAIARRNQQIGRTV